MKHLRISLYTPSNSDTAVSAPWGTFAPGSNVLRVEHVSPDGVNRYTAAHEDTAGAPFDDDPYHTVGAQGSLAESFNWVQPAIQRAYRLGVQDLAAALDVALAGSGEPAAGIVDKLVRALLDEPFVGGEAPALPGTAPSEAPAVDYIVTELREAADRFARAEFHDDMPIREAPALMRRAAGIIASVIAGLKEPA